MKDFSSFLKTRMKDDTGAIGSIETIMLIAVSVMAVMMIIKYIMEPMKESSVGIGETIKEMNPKE